MDQKCKILVAGDVRGNFKQLFSRVESINKKAGPFDMLFCVGDFYSKDNNDELIAYRNGYKNIPVPTYFLGPTNVETNRQYDDNESEICTNLTYLGKRGLYTSSSGLKIAYLSGVESTGKENHTWNFTKEDVVAVRDSCFASKVSLSDYRGIDILITSPWPEGISEDKSNSSKLIAFLAKEIKPRYHFCGMNDKYFEPPPYRNPGDETTQLSLATRFISLAAVGNPEKQKAVYAVSLNPVDKMRVMDLIQKTTNEIASPFSSIDFSMYKRKQDIESGKQYFYDLNKRDDRPRKRRGNNDGSFEKRQRPTYDQESCWFCLSSANVEKHLVISIGENFYLALAKGPINSTHALIVSVTHIQSAALLPDSQWKELEEIKESLVNYFKEQDQVVCFWERNYKCSHLQINAVAIDAGYSWKIKHGFEDKAEEYELTLDELPKLTNAADLPAQGPYFVAELPDGTTLLTKQMKRFPLHFARDVFCTENLLNCEEKVDWKQCCLSKEEETELVQEFRKNYQLPRA